MYGSRRWLSRLLQTSLRPSNVTRRLSQISPTPEAASLLPWRRAAKRQRNEAALIAACSESRRREKFIPVTRRSLLRRLREEEGLLNWQEREKLESFAAALDSCFSQRFLGTLEEAKNLYDAMDPDKDTVRTRQLGRKELLDTEHQLLLLVQRLLDKANYFQVPREQLQELLQDHSTGGLRVSVDPTVYDTLHIWTRGHSKADQPWLQRVRSRLARYTTTSSSSQSDVQDAFSRVFVAVRFRSENRLHLKVFKDVSCDKMEHLLPDGKIMMSEYDKWFLAGSVVVGSSAVALRSLPTLASYKLGWTWAVLGVAALAGVRAWAGYRNKRNKYLASLAATLYFKTVANNRGVLTLLADRAVDEEFKEAFLAYVFLLSPRNRRGVPGTAHSALPPARDTAEELRERVEQWLVGQYQLRGFQFDVEDALGKLGELGLLVRHHNGTLSVLGLEESLSLLPSPGLAWRAVGALRDSASADEGGEREGDHRWR